MGAVKIHLGKLACGQLRSAVWEAAHGGCRQLSAEPGVYSTGSFARYPSRAITEYFSGLPLSSAIFSGLPSSSTRYTFTFRNVPSLWVLVGR